MNQMRHPDQVDTGTCALSDGGAVFILRNENPIFTLLVTDRPDEGVLAEVIMTPDAMSRGAVSAILSNPAGYVEAEVHDLLSFGAAMDAPVDTLIYKCLTMHAPEGFSGYSGDQIQALQDFILERIPESGAQWIKANPTVSGKAMRWVNFLSMGDKEARAQALHEFPIVAGSLLEMPMTVSAIDERKEITEGLAADLKDILGKGLVKFLDGSPGAPELTEKSRDAICLSTARKLLVAEAVARNHLSSNAEDSSGRLAQQAIDFFVETDKKNLNSMVKAIALVRRDQIPDDWNTMVRMRDFFRESITQKITTDLTFSPYMRLAKGIKKDQWAAGFRRLKSSGYDDLSLIRDYLGSTSGRIAAAISIDIMRDCIPRETHDEIAKLSEALWSKKELTPEEAHRMASFLDLCEHDYSKSNTTNISMNVRSIRSDVKRLISGAASLKTIEELQARWHFNNGTIERKVMSDTGTMSWKPILGRIDLGGGIVGREITDSASLMEQGSREKHCIGGHAMRILSATNGNMKAVFSIETEAGDILSTVELGGKITGRGANEEAFWHNCEHRAKRNSAPSEEAQSAVIKLVDILNDLPASRSRRYAASIGLNPSKLISELQRFTTMMSVNPCNPDIPEIALEAVNAVLPKSLRDMSLEGWRNAITRNPESESCKALAEIREKATKVAQKILDIEALNACEEEPAL